MATSASTDVRKWAREHGLTTAERGRLPNSVLEAYAAAHSGDGTAGRTGPGDAEQATSGAKGDAATSRASRTRATRTREGQPAARAGQGREARTAPVEPRRSARPTGHAVARSHDLEERLTAVEMQLAMAVARLEALEGKMTRSLLGLRVTL